MNRLAKFWNSSPGRKIVMALTGLFLVSFLVIHASINALIFYNDGGQTFNVGAHFMGTNPIIRTIEIFLVLGFIIHIVQGFVLWKKNRAARNVGYAVSTRSRASWYSRSMALLGTLILLFLIVHTSNFWIPNRTNQILHGEELPLYNLMLEKFSRPWEVLFYLAGCFSLFWHLLHGFRSAFQSLGLNNRRYDPLIGFVGTAFSVVVPTVLAMMPVSMYFGWVR